MNPFLSLHALNFTGSKLLNQLESFAADNPLKEDLRKLLRKSFIMSILADTYVIAVAGLQGVGKSTLISELYGLEKDILLTNVGQGETLPILITERKQLSPAFFVHKLIKSEYEYKVEKISISQKEFKEKSHQYNSEELMLELEVPEKVFNGVDKHFLLLPGFQSSDSYMKELTYMSLRAASTCMVVFFKERYAHQENMNLVNELATEFNDVKPLFILTRFDHATDDKFREDVIRDLNIIEEETDRVIESGIPGPEDWQQRIINSISKYSSPQKTYLAVRLKNMIQLMNDYENFLASIERFIGKIDAGTENDEQLKVKRIVKAFEKKRKEVETLFKNRLSKRYDAYFSRIVNKIDSELGDEGFWPRLKDNFRNSVKVQNEFKELVSNAIELANSTSVDTEFVYFLNEIQNILLKEHSLLNGLLPENNAGNNTALLAGENNNEFNPVGVSDDTKKDLFNLLKDPSDNQINNVFSKNLENSIKIIPILALESLRIGLILPKTNAGFDPTEDSANLMKIYEENKKEVAIGVGILFGMDVIPDGQLNLFGLFQANTATGGAAGTAATGTGTTATVAGLAVNWALGGLVAAAALIFMIHQLNKSLLDKRHTAVLAVESMKNYCINEYISSFDTRMDKMQELLREILRMRYGFNEKYSNIQNVYDTIHSFEKKLVTIKKEINDVNGKMGWAI